MKDLDWELFDRYLANDATPAERQEFDRWVTERPERAEFLAAWHRGLEKMESGIAAADREAVWAGALERVGSAADAGRGKRANMRPPVFALGEQGKFWHRKPMIAAAALLVLGAALAGRVLLQGPSRSNPAGERVVIVPRGQRAQLRLPDGSQVMVAAGRKVPA